MEEPKIPLNEILGHNTLRGRYKVSFVLNVSEDDDISISDITQAIAAGFNESKLLQRISKLDLEKVDKEGNLLTSSFKVGNKVRLKNDITVKCQVSYESPNYIIGSKNEDADPLGEIETTINQGMIATVNQIDGDDVELIDFESIVMVPLKDSDSLEIVPTVANIDSITISKKNLEKVDA